MDIMPMNLQTEGKQNPVFAQFDQAIESGDASRIYEVIVPIIRGYYFKYTKNPSSLEDVVSIIAEKFFKVIKKHPDMEPNYYWGVIKKGVLWELYSIWKHKNDIFLSELLDVEDHRYPESMMRSVTELYRESAKSLGGRKVRRVLEDAANSFMTAADIMAAYNLSRYEVDSLLWKYKITIIPWQIKKRATFSARGNPTLTVLRKTSALGNGAFHFLPSGLRQFRKPQNSSGRWAHGVTD